jgi:outer membrane protein TolC
MDVRKAWSNLLPQLDLSATGTIVDKDRAEASFGSLAEKSITGSLNISQIIYSDDIWANTSIQRNLQKTRELEFEQLRQDLVLETAVTYLDVLRAKTFERIQKDNLKVTRSNLELARVREAVGASGPGEVFRWESQVATARQTVIESTVLRQITEQALNRLLNQPLDTVFETVEADLNDIRLISSRQKLFDILANPWAFDIFKDFMVQEGKSVSPELRQIEAAIQVQARVKSASNRAFWIPTLAAQAGLNNTFSKSGAGSEPATLDIPGSSFAFPESKDFSWNATLNISYPLFRGGAKFAAYQQASEDLKRLHLEYRAISERLEQRIRGSIHSNRFTYASIKLSKQAADAAQKNLDIVTDAYGRGAVSIIELLDAQNAALVTDLVSANAIYDFLIDLMNTQRAINRFDFFLSAEEQDAWLDRLETYINEKLSEQ